MSDLFERSKLIRSGKIDSEMPDFEELTGWLQRVPKTWLPALLSSCVHQCVIQKIFREGGLISLVKAAEEVAKDPNSILRNQ